MSTITDLTGTTWCFNKVLGSLSRATYNITFISNSHTYSKLKTDARASGTKLSYYPNIYGIDDVVYESSAWSDASFRIITFSGGTDVTNSTLISIIQSNAVNVDEMLVSSVQLPSGEVYKLKDAISGYITADNIKPGENIIFTEDSEGNTVINSAASGSVESVSASGILSSSGGANPNITHNAPSTSPEKTTQAIYPIKIDSYGHITEVGRALDLHEMVILRYGVSKWSDFIDAYRHNAIVYCRASSNSNPASGSQTRMAFMAYVNNADNPTNVEFQYYRSVSSHTFDSQGDEVYIYKLESNNNWSVTVRKAYSKVDTEKGLAYTFSSGTSSVVKLKANLQSETKLSNDSAAATEVSGRVYPVALDKSGYLAVNVPWTDSVNDVKVNGTSILSSGVADLITNTAYDSTDNKIATMSDVYNQLQNKGYVEGYPIHISYTSANDTYSADKTFVQIQSAFNAGKYVYLIDNTGRWPSSSGDNTRTSIIAPLTNYLDDTRFEFFSDIHSVISGSFLLYYSIGDDDVVDVYQRNIVNNYSFNDYLEAGTNITISESSEGKTVISSSGGGGASVTDHTLYFSGGSGSAPDGDSTRY